VLSHHPCGEVASLKDDKANLQAALSDMKGLIEARDKEIAKLRLDLIVALEKIRVYEHKPTLNELLNLMM
jgi:hypothetical protein